MRLDLQKHLVVGAMLSLALCALGATPLQAFYATAAAGVAKELIDLATGKGVPDIADAFVTAVGGALGAVPFFLTR